MYELYKKFFRQTVSVGTGGKALDSNFTLLGDLLGYPTTEYLLSSHTTVIRQEGCGWTPGSYGDGGDSLRSDSKTNGLHFRAATRSIGAFLYLDGRSVCLSRRINGKWQVFRRITLPNTTAWANYRMFDNLDGAKTHYVLHFEKDQYIGKLIVESLDTNALPIRPLLATYGDSTTEGFGTNPNFTDGFLLALALDYQIANRGIAGTTVKNKGGDPLVSTYAGQTRFADLTTLATRPAAVLIAYGLNDYGQVGGSETASELEVAYEDMLTSITAVLDDIPIYNRSIQPTDPTHYPGGRDTYSTAIQTAVTNVNTANGNTNCVYFEVTDAQFPYADNTIDGVHLSELGYEVMEAFDEAVVAQNESVLASTYPIVADATFVNTGLQIRLPSAGTYDLQATLRVFIGADNTAYITARLHDGTNPIPNTETLAYLMLSASTSIQVTAPIISKITVTAPTIISVQVSRTVAGGGTFSFSSIMSDSDGRSKIKWTRHV